jgi:hypothetical protein
VIRIRLVKSWAVVSFHATPNKTQHGPQSWTWWRLFSLGLIRLDIHKPNTGYRLWIYTRWGVRHVDIFVDRRERIVAR